MTMALASSLVFKIIHGLRILLLCLCFSTCINPFFQKHARSLKTIGRCRPLMLQTGLFRLRGGFQNQDDPRQDEPQGPEGMDTDDEDEQQQSKPEGAWSGMGKPLGDCGAIPGMHADEALQKVKVLLFVVHVAPKQQPRLRRVDFPCFHHKCMLLILWRSQAPPPTRVHRPKQLDKMCYYIFSAGSRKRSGAGLSK
jgi:hypothetical protein